MYVYLYAKQVISLRVAIRCTISPLYPTAKPQWAIEEQEANFVVNSTAFAWHLAKLVILSLCNEGTWMDTCLARHCEGVACETLRSEPPFTACLAVGLTPIAKRMCLLVILDVRNTITQCLHFCCTKNRIIISFLRVRINWSTKLASSAGKGRFTN